MVAVDLLPGATAGGLVVPDWPTRGMHVSVKHSRMFAWHTYSWKVVLSKLRVFGRCYACA